MIVAIELDGVLCNPILNSVTAWEVKDRTVKAEILEFIKHLKEKGHDIVIYTDRDPSLMIETEAWLNKNKVPYHHVVYGLPHKDICFSTNSMKFIDKASALEQVKLHGGQI